MRLQKLKTLMCYGWLALLPLLVACKPAMLGTNVVGYNHRDIEIEFSVNGQAGAYLQPHKGGGKFSCCVSIPSPWQPDMTVTVRWQEGISDAWFEKTVPVPEYANKNIGSMSVHFLRNGQINVFVTPYTLWHPDYPLKGPEAPLDPTASKVASPW